MKHKLLLTTLLFLVFTSLSFTQTLFKGMVADEQTKKPIASAKVGVSNQGVGTLTNQKGRFSYRKYDQTLDKESQLIVSAPGYKTLLLDLEQLREIYNINATILLTPGKEKEAVQKGVVSVFWDISEGMIDRDASKELAYLETYLGQFPEIKVNFVQFNDKIRSWQTERIVRGDISRFRESIEEVSYTGPANYDLIQMEGVDKVLLFSNGDPTFGTLRAGQDIPVSAITTVSEVNEEVLNEIVGYTGGELLFLENVSIQDIKSDLNKNVSRKAAKSRTVSGKVTSLGNPLQGATISKLGTFLEEQSNAEGDFTIQATLGDILVVNALGMFEKRFEIASNEKLQVDMIPESDVLDEVVLTGTKEKIIVGNTFMDGRPSKYFPGGTTGFGDFYITAEDITPNARTLEQVLVQKFKAVQIRNTPTQGPILLVRGRAPQYVVNGFLLGPGEPPPLYISDTEIESVVLKYGSEETSRYTPGNLLGGVAIIVTTKNSSFVKELDKYNPLVKGNDYHEEVAISKQVIESTSSNKITGKVMSLGNPLKGAVISKRGTFDEYKTDINGDFSLNAIEGDELIISHLGMYPKGVLITSETNFTINLLPKSDVLDEVTLTGSSKKNAVLEDEENRVENNVGYASAVLTKKDLDKGYPDLGVALNGKVSGISAVEDPINGLTVISLRAGGSMLIVIDNQIFTNDSPRPFISPDRVSKVVVIKGLAGANRYGSLGSNGVVEITTNTFQAFNQVKPKSALVKGNDYNDKVKSIAQRVVAKRSTGAPLQIKGKVISSGKSIAGASINIKGTFDEFYTKENGTFEIAAKRDDILIIKALGMYKKELLLENQSNLTIELIPNNESLDEIVVSGSKRVDNTIETAYGKENTDKIGYSVDEIKSESFNTGATNLRQLITGRFPGVRVIGGTTGFSGSSVIYQIRGGNQSIENDIPPAWVVNGVITDQEPSYIDVQQIASISVLKSVIATNKYGTIAAGGAFVITTKNYIAGNSQSENRRSALVTGNNYVNDAISVKNLDEQEYITRLREIPLPEDKFAAYRSMARTKELSLEFYSDMARYFQEVDLNLADKVRSDLAYVARKNAKAMRTLAYLYEEAGDIKKTLLAYERVLKLVPNEAQSYRDVANAYVMNREYNKALEVYINALGERIRGVDFTGIEKVLKSELSRLVQLHKDKIEFSRLPNEWLRADFKQDVRMVIEWSDATVPFEFQFVNPEKKFFKWNHTLEENRERLESEKRQGFQIEEFTIDDAPRGEWLINVQYLGQEDDYILPPFLKYTLYRDYGTPTESKELRVIKLFRQTEKVTLGKIEI